MESVSTAAVTPVPAIKRALAALARPHGRVRRTVRLICIGWSRRALRTRSQMGLVSEPEDDSQTNDESLVNRAIGHVRDCLSNQWSVHRSLRPLRRHQFLKNPADEECKGGDMSIECLWQRRPAAGEQRERAFCQTDAHGGRARIVDDEESDTRVRDERASVCRKAGDQILCSRPASRRATPQSPRHARSPSQEGQPCPRRGRTATERRCRAPAPDDALSRPRGRHDPAGRSAASATASRVSPRCHAPRAEGSSDLLTGVATAVS